tara:strand:- start:14565 stop:15326 length:762 start_codon:yes stop_codon:yes gene_type:complete
MIEIILIGFGNLGSYFFDKFYSNKKLKLKGLYTRKKSLNYPKDLKLYKSINQIDKADIYIIAVSDKSIIEITKSLKIKSGCVVHTSGSIEMNVLNKFKNYGVIYPVQTFSKKIKLSNDDFPFLIESNNSSSRKIIENTLDILKAKYHYFSSKKRLIAHLGAVISNNFVNHLNYFSKEILEEHNIDFNILKPLIKETIYKINKYGPVDMQTGPAIRNDISSIKKHQKLLSNNNFIETYNTISDSIVKLYSNEKL